MTTGGPPYGVLLRAFVNHELVVDVPLAHGQDPAALLTQAGWRVERPLAAVREGPAIVLDFAVRATSTCAPSPRLTDGAVLRPGRASGGGLGGRSAGSQGDVARDGGLVLRADEVPVVKQRVSAAVLVTADVPVGITDSQGRPGPGGRCVLAARYAAVALRLAGTWGLPGGGVEPDEQPADAARREAAEETGQEVRVGDLAFVQSAHWVGRAPSGTVEDYQAVRLIFHGECDTPGPVVVRDVDGTTSAAAWVPVAAAPSWAWASGAREQLTVLGVLG